MSPKEYYANAEYWKKRDKEYSEWRKKALHILLTKIAPKMERCRDSALMRTFGDMIRHLASPIHLLVQDCEKFDEKIANMTLNEIIFEEIVKDVKKIR